MTDATRHRVRRVCMLLVALASAVAGACKRQEASTEPDAAATSTAGVTDPLWRHENALAENADKLRGLGVVLDESRRAEPESEAKSDSEAKPTPTPDPAPTANDESGPPKPDALAATRCTALCGLANTACELRTQICELAEDHVGEPRYEDACWRATDQCDRASTACEDCRGTTAGSARGC